MGELELIFFAGVALFFAYKLWSVLGKTNGDEKSRAAEIATIIEAQPAKAEKPKLIGKTQNKQAEPVEEVLPEKFKDKILAIRAIDSSFSYAGFLKGAEAAYEAVIEAYSKANRNRLKFLLNEAVFAEFDEQLNENEGQDRKANISLVSVNIADAEQIELNGNTARITLRFDSEQISYTTDSENKIVEGSKSVIEKVSDLWVFERDLSSRKPQWLIVATD